MNDQTQDKKYACTSCGSESSGTPGTCCGAKRKEEKESGTCIACDEHKEHTHK